MKVENWMTERVVTISPAVGIRESLEMMKQHKVRHLPVMEAGELVGLVTLADLKQSILASMIEELNVRDVMIRDPFIISPTTTLEQAARIIYEENVGCLPVLESDTLVGVITIKDILKAFIEIMGVLKAGTRLDVILKQVPGSFDEVVGLIQTNGGYVISVGMSINGDETLHHFRISGGEVDDVATELTNLGYRGVKVIA